MKLVRKRKARGLVEAARAYLDRQSEHQVSRLLGRRAQLRP